MNQRVVRVLAALPASALEDEAATNGEYLAALLPGWPEEDCQELMAVILKVIMTYYGIEAEEDDDLMSPLAATFTIAMQLGRVTRDMSLAGTL